MRGAGSGPPPFPLHPLPWKISNLLNSHDSEFPENRPRTNPSPPWKTKLPMAAPPPEKNSESAHDLVLFIPCINQRFALHYRNKIMTGKVLLFIVLHANILNNRTVQKYFALGSSGMICLLVLHNYHHNYTVK